MIKIKENKNFVRGSNKENNYKFYRKNVAGIYKIYHDITKQYYIGSSSDIGRRLSHHFGHLKNNKHVCFRLQKLYNETKYEDFSFNVIEISDKNERISKELELLDENKDDPLLLNSSTSQLYLIELIAKRSYLLIGMNIKMK